MFTERPLWTSDNVEYLVQHFAENPDEREGGFLGTLEGKLAPSPAGAKQLAAEMFWIVEADLRRPGSIAIDEIAERVYWTHQAVIHRSNLDGTDLEVYSRAAGSG